ncbi:MAG: energy transducer TonB [Salinivirgaceae bacterium]|nr:energy transducer TonB [Salinivirgaceae bacterium]
MKNQLNKLAKSSTMLIIALQCNSAMCQTADNQPNIVPKDSTAVNQANIKDDDVFFVVEDMPEFPCGEVGLRKYLAENTSKPIVNNGDTLYGDVFVSFVIGQDGEVEPGSVKIARGIDPLLDAEAIRIVKSMPTWKPATQRGKPVKVKYTIRITFPLNNTTTVEKMPEFPGRSYGLEKYITEQLSEQLKTVKKKNGKYSFIINKQGFVENVRVVRSINSAMDAFVISVLQDMPQWDCACFRNEPDKSPVTVSITTDKYGRLSVKIGTYWV